MRLLAKLQQGMTHPVPSTSAASCLRIGLGQPFEDVLRGLSQQGYVTLQQVLANLCPEGLFPAPCFGTALISGYLADHSQFTTDCVLDVLLTRLALELLGTEIC